MTAICIEDARPVYLIRMWSGTVEWIRVLPGTLKLMDSVSGAPVWTDSYPGMFLTSINPTLNGCKEWRHANAYTDGMKPDTPEPDTVEKNL